MPRILDLSRDLTEISVEAGDVILGEGETSDRLYILVEGVLEVYRGDVSVAVVNEPGAVFGEMAVLLGGPHTASVRALRTSRLRAVEDALSYLTRNPVLMVPIAQLLAQRLRNSTTYLVDLKRQFQDHGNHLSLVDLVLESLAHQQAEPQVRPGVEPPPSP
ncbi:MAG: Crp/Fnr family transcriptional regulator [Bauldia sp.]